MMNSEDCRGILIISVAMFILSVVLLIRSFHRQLDLLDTGFLVIGLIVCSFLIWAFWELYREKSKEEQEGTISISMNVKGKIFRGYIEPDVLFSPELIKASCNGKSPVKALVWLAAMGKGLIPKDEAEYFRKKFLTAE